MSQQNLNRCSFCDHELNESDKSCPICNTPHNTPLNRLRDATRRDEPNHVVLFLDRMFEEMPRTGWHDVLERFNSDWEYFEPMIKWFAYLNYSLFDGIQLLSCIDITLAKNISTTYYQDRILKLEKERRFYQAGDIAQALLDYVFSTPASSEEYWDIRRMMCANIAEGLNSDASNIRTFSSQILFLLIEHKATKHLMI